MDILLIVGGWLVTLLVAFLSARFGAETTMRSVREHQKGITIRERKKELSEFGTEVLESTYIATKNHVFTNEERNADHLISMVQQMGNSSTPGIREMIRGNPTLLERTRESEKDRDRFRCFTARCDFIVSDEESKSAFDQLRQTLLFSEFTSADKDEYHNSVAAVAEEFKKAIQNSKSDESLENWYRDTYRRSSPSHN